jgi:hypothetical protein
LQHQTVEIGQVKILLNRHKYWPLRVIIRCTNSAAIGLCSLINALNINTYMLHDCHMAVTGCYNLVAYEVQGIHKNGAWGSGRPQSRLTTPISPHFVSLADRNWGLLIGGHFTLD